MKSWVKQAKRPDRHSVVAGSGRTAMLTIHLIVVGDKMPSWVEQGYNEYQKRIKGRVALNLIEVSAIRRGKNADLERIARDEDLKLLGAIPKGCKTIALDRTGKQLSTLQIVDHMKSWLQQGDQIAMLVGGPEGLSKEVLGQADLKWSLSALTFAHPVVRIVLAEQIYRCFSVLENAPYHR